MDLNPGGLVGAVQVASFKFHRSFKSSTYVFCLIPHNCYSITYSSKMYFALFLIIVSVTIQYKIALLHPSNLQVKMRLQKAGHVFPGISLPPNVLTCPLRGLQPREVLAPGGPGLVELGCSGAPRTTFTPAQPRPSGRGGDHMPPQLGLGSAAGLATCKPHSAPAPHHVVAPQPQSPMPRGGSEGRVGNHSLAPEPGGGPPAAGSRKEGIWRDFRCGCAR